jgi:hypothetical protein
MRIKLSENNRISVKVLRNKKMTGADIKTGTPSESGSTGNTIHMAIMFLQKTGNRSVQ